MISLGCAKNLVNSEQMMHLLKEAGYGVTGDADGADVVIINTCAFIETAKTEAIETILEIGQKKQEGAVGRIIVAGCLPQRYKDEIMEEMPEIDATVGVGSFDEIVAAVTNVLDGKQNTAMYGNINSPVSETSRIITTSKTWTYLKIAEGCDNRCAFCVIPSIRGRYRSRPIENITAETRRLAEQGIKELIIVAQDVTRYGLDLYGKRRLTDLLEDISSIDGIKWIRLHYLYPDEIDDSLIETIATNEKILKYLDIPIQHINDAILKKMRRRGTSSDIRALVKRLRGRIDNVVIRTSIITGLPGENEKEFDELCRFLLEAKIERAGVFPYSPEEGTPAAQMERPDAETAERRAQIISDIQSNIMHEFSASRIGNATQILIEGRANGNHYGRSYAESPEIDGYITVKGKNIKIGAFVTARITDIDEASVGA